MAKKQRTEGQAKRDFIKLCAFIALLISAFLFVFGALFSGAVNSVLNLVAKLALLVAIAFPAYSFSRGCTKVWRIIFWIALVIYIAGCVLGLLDGLKII